MRTDHGRRPIPIPGPVIGFPYHIGRQKVILPGWQQGRLIVRIEQLEYVAAVARLGSFRRAAESGRDILQHVLTVLDAVERLRDAADEQHRSRRAVRLGTVNTATVPLVAPVIREFRERYDATQVEIIGGLHAEVQERLLEGSVDLGLVNYLDGD